MADEDQQQINLPSLAVIIVLSGLIIRYLFFSSPAGGARQGAAAAAAARSARGDPAALVRSREAAVERIQQMFPQVERRMVLWDLQRTGGSVAATTERILAGRLETVRSSLLRFLLYLICLWHGWLMNLNAYSPRSPSNRLRRLGVAMPKLRRRPSLRRCRPIRT